MLHFFIIATCCILLTNENSPPHRHDSCTLNTYKQWWNAPPAFSSLCWKKQPFFVHMMLLALNLAPFARLFLGDPLFELESPELDTVLQMQPQWGRVDEKDHFLQCAGHAPFNATHCPGSHWSSWPQGHNAGSWPTCWPPGRRLQGAAELLYSRSAPNLYWCMWLFLPCARFCTSSC